MSRKKVLVVDDSAAVRQQVASVLSGAGFDIVEAVDGQAGRAAIESTPDIAVVLCDVNMPRMNGLEMLAEVKAEPKNAKLPVLMLTTEGQPALMRRAKELGAMGWIVKPFNPAQLIAAVQRIAR